MTQFFFSTGNEQKKVFLQIEKWDRNILSSVLIDSAKEHHYDVVELLLKYGAGS